MIVEKGKKIDSPYLIQETGCNQSNASKQTSDVISNHVKVCENMHTCPYLGQPARVFNIPSTMTPSQLPSKAD